MRIQRIKSKVVSYENKILLVAEAAIFTLKLMWLQAETWRRYFSIKNIWKIVKNIYWNGRIFARRSFFWAQVIFFETVFVK